MNGPGKYDHICELAMQATMATGVVLIVHDGYLGHGFEIHGPAQFIADLPRMLRAMAEEIENDLPVDTGG